MQGEHFKLISSVLIALLVRELLLNISKAVQFVYLDVLMLSYVLTVYYL